LINTAAAQDAEDVEEEFDFSQLEGIEQVVGRNYSMDFEALMAASPEAIEDMTYPTGIVTAFAVVAKFDGDDNAEAGWESLREAFGEQAATMMGTEDAEVTEVDVEDLADNAAGYTSAVEEDGMTFNVAILILREGEHAYVSVVSTGGDDATAPATSLAEAMIDADAGDGEGEANEDGVYSGGLWDKFPPEGDESVEGLIIATDEVIYPESDDAAEE
jgi:hypothetical protein